MPGVQIKEVRQVSFFTDEGIEFYEGDTVMLRVENKDFVAVFKGASNGLMTLDSIYGDVTYKIRTASIAKMKVVTQIEVKNEYNEDKKENR